MRTVKKRISLSCSQTELWNILSELTEEADTYFYNLNGNYLYSVCQQYKNSIPDEAYNNAELVIYNDFTSEIVLKEKPVASYRISSKRTEILKALESYKLDTSWYITYRDLFKLSRLSPVHITIDREDNEIRLLYMHKKYFDIFEEVNSFNVEESNPNREYSGFISLARIGDNGYNYEKVNLSCKNAGGQTVVTILSEDYLAKYEYTDWVLNVETLEDIDEYIINSLDDIFTDSDDLGIQPYILSLIQEIVYNFMMHDGTDEEVILNIYNFKDSPTVVFNKVNNVSVVKKF